MDMLVVKSLHHNGKIIFFFNSTNCTLSVNHLLLIPDAICDALLLQRDLCFFPQYRLHPSTRTLTSGQSLLGSSCAYMQIMVDDCPVAYLDAN